MGKNQSEEDKRIEKINGVLAELKYKDLQSEVIQRGMAFKDAIESDHGGLASYLFKAFEVKKNPELLKDFEKHVDMELDRRGHKKDDPIRQYRKFSTEEPKEEKPKPIKVIKEPKKKKEKDKKFNIYTGTKKQLTYELTQNLFDKLGKKYKYNAKDLCKKFSGQLFTKVSVKFPEAQDKSIKIWMSRCMKQLCDGKA